MYLAFDFISQENGIDDMSSYPYTGVDDKCSFKKDKVAFSDSGHMGLAEGDENMLKVVVAMYGPVSVAIDASDVFQLYDSGVLHDDSCDKAKLNHGVLVVGYGTDPVGGDYWIVVSIKQQVRNLSETIRY